MQFGHLQRKAEPLGKDLKQTKNVRKTVCSCERTVRKKGYRKTPGKRPPKMVLLQVTSVVRVVLRKLQTEDNPACVCLSRHNGIVPLYLVSFPFMHHATNAQKGVLKKDTTQMKISADNIGRTVQYPPKMATAGREGQGRGCTDARRLTGKRPIW